MRFPFYPPLYHWCLQFTAVVPRRRRDVDASAVVDAQVLLTATETCAPAVGPHSAPAHLLCPFSCVMLPFFFALVSVRLQLETPKFL